MINFIDAVKGTKFKI